MDIRTNGNVRYYTGDITPGDGIVMVFGSNPEGRHGAGAAKVAREQFGAVYGQGEGLQGNAYALPTKDLRVKENRGLRSISPEAITENIKRLYETARENPDRTFCIAYRNTGRQSLNGYTGIEMMRMFADAGPLPWNILVSEEWYNAGQEILSFEPVEEVGNPFVGIREDAPGGDGEWPHTLDELLDFHAGSLRTYVDDDLSTAHLPLEEVMGTALSNAVRDAVERGDDLSEIRAWAQRTLREETMTDEQRAVAEESLGTFIPSSLSEYVRSSAFKKKYGDWEKGASDLVLDSRGEPLVLWHGSPAEFEAFDLSHAGENTGITEYTLKSTGEKTVSDSDRAVFFTDNRQLAVSYAFLARTQQLSRYSGLLTDIGSLLNNPQGSIVSHIRSKSELIEAVNELRKENDADMNAVLDRLPDLNGEHPVSSMSEADRKALAQDMFALRGRYSEYHRMNAQGGISNRLNNFVRMQEYLPYFRENFGRLCGNDRTVLSVFGDDITEHSIGFYREGNGAMGISVFWDPDTGRVKASGFRQEPVFLDTLGGAEREEFLQMIEDDLAVCIRNYNEDMKRAGFERSTHLYPVFLKAANPLMHDYKESSFPDKYKPNEKYKTAYIAARQVAKALADGNDAVVYQNIRDPFLGTTYGVFSADNIIMIDKSLMPEEVLSPRLEIKTDKSMVRTELAPDVNYPEFLKQVAALPHPLLDMDGQYAMLMAVCECHGGSVSFPEGTHLGWAPVGYNGVDMADEAEVFIRRMYVKDGEILCDTVLDNGHKVDGSPLRDQVDMHDFIRDNASGGLLHPLRVEDNGHLYIASSLWDESRMPERKENTIVIYHSRDWDGWTSGALAREAERKANPDARIDAFGWTYGDALPDVSGYDKVVLVDLTISEKTEQGPDYSWMKENAGKLLWIDHHRNSIEALPELKDVPGLRDTDGALSACRLAWAQYHPGEDEPGHVKYVGLTDIQKRDDPEFQDAADYALFLNRTYGRDVTLDTARDVMAADVGKALEKGREYEKERAAHEAEVWSEGLPIEYQGRKGILLANDEQPSVVIKDHLASPGDVDFIVLYKPITGQEGQYKCSVRVPEGKDFDGAAYAAQWGGGGHRAAAGWVFDEGELNRIINSSDKHMGNNRGEIIFREDSSPYYKERTRRNAEAADVTIAFAVDFSTAGEKCTKNVAGDKYIAINLPPMSYYKNPENMFNKALLRERVETIEAGIMQLSEKYGFVPIEVNVNVAGNGLYTLTKQGITQTDVDRFVTDVFRLMEKRPNVHVTSIRSGGQTGIDEAGIKAAVELGIPATVLAPQGWKFRDGSGNDISDEKAFKARFPEGPVKENGMKPLSREETIDARGGVEIPQQVPTSDAFRRMADSAVSSGKVKSVGELKDGWALVQAKTGQFNFTNAKGQFITNRWFDSATEFSNGFATIKRDGCTARINSDGIAVEVVNNMAQKTGSSPKIR